MINVLDNAGLLLGNGSLDELKRSAKEQTPESLKLVAKQFEALFMTILTKSMRSSSSGSLLDSQDTKLYTELLDQQFAQKISSGRGLGLADALVQQISRNQAGAKVAEAPLGPLPLQRESGPLSQGLPGNAQQPLPLKPKHETQIKPLDASTPAVPASPRQDFINRILPHAKTAASVLGVAPQAILAQAALETGWGKHQIKQADGSPSHNIFGIKANANWTGKTVDVVTTEYVQGVAQKRVEKFRAYDSYADAFRDYAGLLQHAPRYRGVLNAPNTEAFAQGLQKAGYATDPAYAAKITRVAQSPVLQVVA